MAHLLFSLLHLSRQNKLLVTLKRCRNFQWTQGCQGLFLAKLSEIKVKVEIVNQIRRANTKVVVATPTSLDSLALENIG